MTCNHCQVNIECDCNSRTKGLHTLDCTLRLYLAGNSHNGQGARDRIEAENSQNCPQSDFESENESDTHSTDKNLSQVNQ